MSICRQVFTQSKPEWVDDLGTTKLNFLFLLCGGLIIIRDFVF